MRYIVFVGIFASELFPDGALEQAIAYAARRGGWVKDWWTGERIVARRMGA